MEYPAAMEHTEVWVGVGVGEEHLWDTLNGPIKNYMIALVHVAQIEDS